MRDKWTCGECGESYESEGVVGDMRVARWRREHKEEHRVQKMSPEGRKAYHDQKARALVLQMDLERKAHERMRADLTQPSKKKRGLFR